MLNKKTNSSFLGLFPFPVGCIYFILVNNLAMAESFQASGQAVFSPSQGMTPKDRGPGQVVRHPLKIITKG